MSRPTIRHPPRPAELPKRSPRTPQLSAPAECVRREADGRGIATDSALADELRRLRDELAAVRRDFQAVRAEFESTAQQLRRELDELNRQLGN